MVSIGPAAQKEVSSHHIIITVYNHQETLIDCYKLTKHFP